MVEFDMAEKGSYNSYMVSDFSDIRFVNASENEELPFYLYAKSNSNWAEFYIKGNWSVNNGTQLYVYYSNNTHLCSFFNQTNTSAILRFRTDNAQANFYTTDGANTDTAWPAKDTNYHKYQVYRFDATKTAFWQNTTTRNSTGGTGRPAHPLPILLGTDTGVTGSNVKG